VTFSTAAESTEFRIDAAILMDSLQKLIGWPNVYTKLHFSVTRASEILNELESIGQYGEKGSKA